MKTGYHLLCLCVSFVWMASVYGSWQDNVKPIVYAQLGSDEAHRFRGNLTSVDHFRLLLSHGDSILVGARNAVYNLSLPSLTETKKLDWPASDEHVKLCLLKGKSEEECQNYIRVMGMKSSDRLQVCGTHAYKPICREYVSKDGNFVHEKQYSGQGISPYDPAHNSTAIFVDGELFVGTVADFSGMDPLIYREPLRTEQYDATNLNGPNFVSSFAHSDYVYFTFRETAVEYINCGKTVYSRIGRVCKQDRGGPHKFRYRWTSFLKARLNCSVSGDFPFYFNEIQSMSGPHETRHNGKRADIIYATFTTPPNSIPGSAVCAFYMHDVERIFDGPFKEQASMNYNWLPVQPHKVPEPRPGQCVNDSQTLPDFSLNFIKSHSLMDDSVPSTLNEPLIIRTGFHHRFTKIEVDPQVKTPDGKYYDVLFIGTDNGKVIKAIRTDAGAVVIEEIQVFPVTMSVTNLMIHRGRGAEHGGDAVDARLVVVSHSEIAALKLQRCYTDRSTSCSECVRLRDPYCAWDKRKQKCVAVGAWALGTNLFQSVSTGTHDSCPDALSHGKGLGKSPPAKDNQAGFISSSSVAEASLFNADLPAPASSSPTSSRGGKAFAEADRDGQTKHDNDASADSDLANEDDDDGPRVMADESQPLYTVETLTIAVIAGSLAALFLGFVLGYCCGRKCRKNEEDNMPYPDTEYEYFEQRQNCHMRRLPQDPKLLQQEEAAYAEPILVPVKPITLTTSNLNSTLPTSPKATLRKVANHNAALFEANPTPPPVPSGPPFAFGDNLTRDPYSSFRSRDAYGGGSIRSNGPYAHHGAAGPADTFGTLRSNKNLGDGFGTTRSVKKVYL